MGRSTRELLANLCAGPDRRVGGGDNLGASHFCAEYFVNAGWAVETEELTCIDWTGDRATMSIDGTDFAVLPSPYSLGFEGSGRLESVGTVEELESVTLRDSILLLHGSIASEPLMPKNFTFYNPDEHKRIVSLLEKSNAAAILAATGRHPELAGGLYPFPLIEDGDFDIPSAYTTETIGESIKKHAGAHAELSIRAERIPATCINVTARAGSNHQKRVVIFAHIDTKPGTPGAIDNATGVVVLLKLSDLLREYKGNLGVELVAVNGEDYYSAPGQVRFVERNAGAFDEIVLGVNIDAAGYSSGKSHYSHYLCPEPITTAVRRVARRYHSIAAGPQWYQSDHMIFAQNDTPALAFTSSELEYLTSRVTHTRGDTPDIVDCGKLSDIAQMLRDLIHELDDVDWSDR